MDAERFFDRHHERSTVAGPYCRYCGDRCFVYRVLPDRSWAGHLATCTDGMANDMARLGYNHWTAINPIAVARLLTLIRDHTELTDGAQIRRILAVTLRGLSLSEIKTIASQYPNYITYLETPVSRYGPPVDEI